MSEEPVPQVLDPKKVLETGQQVLSVLYEGFIDIGAKLTEANAKISELEQENSDLKIQVNGLVNKLLNGDNNETKTCSCSVAAK